MTESPFEREQEQEAAAEAAAIGGRDPMPGEDIDEADRAVEEGGGGESEGFELAEAELEENASHGDEHSAGRVLEDAYDDDEDERAVGGGEADEETGPDA